MAKIIVNLLYFPSTLWLMNSGSNRHIYAVLGEFNCLSNVVSLINWHKLHVVIILVIQLLVVSLNSWHNQHAVILLGMVSSLSTVFTGFGLYYQSWHLRFSSSLLWLMVHFNCSCRQYWLTNTLHLYFLMLLGTGIFCYCLIIAGLLHYFPVSIPFSVIDIHFIFAQLQAIFMLFTVIMAIMLDYLMRCWPISPWPVSLIAFHYGVLTCLYQTSCCSFFISSIDCTIFICIRGQLSFAANNPN
jgi:hypothetical protein